MPELYRLSVGPIGAAYYQQHFQRFESMGKAVPTWNHGAAFFTLAWLLLRKLWRPAAIYAALLVSCVLVWWYGIHGKLPLTAEISVCAISLLLLCVLPGFLGTALYYQHIRNQTLQTLGKASSLAQARVMLSNDAPTKERLQVAAVVQALVAAAIAGLAFFQMDAPDSRPAVPVSVGPPNIVIPSVESLRAQQPQAFTPSAALPVVETAPAAPSPIATAQTEEAPATQAPASKEDELSIVQLAQAVPASGAAAAIVAATQPANATNAAPPLQPQPSASASKTAPAAHTAHTSEVPSKRAVGASRQTASAKTSERARNQRLIPGKFYLNAGVYAQASNVDAAVKRLHAAKLTTLQQTVQSNKGELTRLRIGPFDTRRQAEQAAVKAQRLRIETSVFQQPKP